jgi:hypothetical protein
MGGNDVHFANVLNFCFSTSACPDKPYQGAASLRDWIETELTNLTPELLDVYRRIRRDAPDARVLVLGYPSLFPEKAPSHLNPRNTECTLLFSRWDALERTAIRQWGQELNGIIQADAYDAGVEYVDTSGFFSGHEPCGADGEWVRFVGLSSRPVRDGSFHPRQVGQAMMARIVSCHLHVYAAGASQGSKNQDLVMTGCVLSGVKESPGGG